MKNTFHFQPFFTGIRISISNDPFFCSLVTGFVHIFSWAPAGFSFPPESIRGDFFWCYQPLFFNPRNLY